MSSALNHLEQVLSSAKSALSLAFRTLGNSGSIDENQWFAYELAHAYSVNEVAIHFTKYGRQGEQEEALAIAFGLEAVREVSTCLLGRRIAFDLRGDEASQLEQFAEEFSDPAHYTVLVDVLGSDPIPDELRLVRKTFRQFAQERVEPIADQIHRGDADIPPEIIEGLAEMGAFAMSIDAQYGGMASDEVGPLGMLIATEELSRVSLAAGSLMTRPEILVRALHLGGTKEQKALLLSRIASGEMIVAISVTEPDQGSDIARLRFSATPDGDEWVLNGSKTWCTFAGQASALAVLARTGPDEGYRGLSLFLVEKPSSPGKAFLLEQPRGGKLEGRAIDTIGYRGLHSFDLTFDSWRVPETALIGGPAGVGRGFQLQLAGFERGRLQTAARAVGVMQRAYDESRRYAAGRHAFSKRLLEFELTQVKLGRMAAIIQACRQYGYFVGSLFAEGSGSLESALIKLYSCRAAQWVTREAMQLHGGSGYAEENVVSRLFVDARVLPIFEGADEVLALRVIARQLMRTDPKS